MRSTASRRKGALRPGAGYGLSASVQQGLSGRGLSSTVGIAKLQKVYPSDVALVFPVAGPGRPRKNQSPDRVSLAAEAVLATARWHQLS